MLHIVTNEEHFDKIKIDQQNSLDEAILLLKRLNESYNELNDSDDDVKESIKQLYRECMNLCLGLVDKLNRIGSSLFFLKIKSNKEIEREEREWLNDLEARNQEFKKKKENLINGDR